jgi:hypothetical protein
VLPLVGWSAEYTSPARPRSRTGRRAW